MQNNLIETFGDLLDLRDKPFVMVDKKIIEDVETFNKNELLAYIVICKFADNSNRQAFPSISTVAKFMRTSKETARIGIKGLIEKGVLVYQQRVNPNNPNENTSNAYAIVDNKNWAKAKIQNSNVIKEREEKYSKRVEKSKKTKMSNKKVASTANTNNLDESSDCDSKNSIDTSIVPQNEKNIQDTNDNINLLKSSGIKYIPYKKENKNILSMNTDILKKSIEITKEKAIKPNWNYLFSTYEDLISQKDEIDINYSPEELKRRLLESQKGKFANNSISKLNPKVHNFPGSANFLKYSPEELEIKLRESQKDKF